MSLIVRYLTVAFLGSWSMLAVGLALSIYAANPTWGDRLVIGGFVGAIYSALSFGLAVAIRDVWQGWVSDDD